MKIKEILLELREILNRTDYGAWINTNTQEIYPVTKQGGHIDFITIKLPEWNIPKEYLKNSNLYYYVGYAHGLVRAVFKPSTDIQFEGMAKDLRKISRMIVVSAAQPDVQIVRINKLHDLEDAGHSNFKTFIMPNELNELKTYL
jgi:hypothetical protein